MAEIAATIQNTKPGGNKNISSAYVLYQWSAITDADTGASVRVEGHLTDRTVAFSGTFGGATLGIEGSMDNTNWFALADASGTTIAATAAGIFTISQNAIYYRISRTGGSSSSVLAQLMATG